MQNKIFKVKNLKTKVISLITAIAVWMYVIAVVDPDEKKVIENIPITITNQNEIRKDDFVIYPKEDLKTDITLQGRLSEIQKLNKNNIHIYGDIINPVEGQNIVTLRTNISNRVSRDLKDSTFVVNLERYVTKKVKVKINIPDNIKSVIESAKISKDYVLVSGPRSLVNNVEYVGSTLMVVNTQDKESDIIRLNLIPYNKENVPVDDVVLSQKKINVDVRYTLEKTIPVDINYDGDNPPKTDYTTQPDKLTILGDADKLRIIDSINTVKLTSSDLESSNNRKVKIIIPDNIRIKDNIKEITIIKK